MGKIFVTMLLYFVIPLNLICNMTVYWKKFNFDRLTLRSGGKEFWGQNICYHIAIFRDSI